MATISLPQLPSMRCDDDCGECCGVNFVRREEYRRIEGIVKARGIKPVRQGVRCPLYQSGKCTIYESRPLVCQLFGHVEAMNCPRGYNVNIPADQQRLWQQQMAQGHGMRSLHELVYSIAEVKQIVQGEMARHQAQQAGQTPTQSGNPQKGPG